MDKILHDYVIIEPIQDNGVLKSLNENINSGIVQGFGPGIFEYGIEIPVSEIAIGNKIIFTQHLQLDIDNEKIYIVRWRDIIMVKDEDKT